MKRIVLLVLTSISFFLAGCQTQASGDPGLNIVTSFYPVYAITDYVSGDLNQVRMIQSSSGIHHFEPSANDIAAIEEADMFIYHSRTLESWAQNLDETTSTDIVEASEGISLLPVPGLEDYDVPEGMDDKAIYDPHSWNDPLSAAEEAHIIARALGEKDPENAAYYQDRADQFQAEAQTLVDKYADSLANKEHKKIVTQHTAFQYLTARFGLEEIGIGGVSDELEISPKRMAEIIDFIEANDIQVIFRERNDNGKVAETVAQEAGIEVQILDPLEADPENGKSFLENLEIQIQTLDTYLD